MGNFNSAFFLFYEEHIFLIRLLKWSGNFNCGSRLRFAANVKLIQCLNTELKIGVILGDLPSPPRIFWRRNDVQQWSERAFFDYSPVINGWMLPHTLYLLLNWQGNWNWPSINQTDRCEPNSSSSNDKNQI